MKKGDVIELQIEKYAFEGKGIAKISRSKIKQESNPSETDDANYVVFVHGSYPGDTVNARLRKIKNSYSEAKAIDIISPSNDRIKPECKFFGTCGGCKQQDLNYQKQIYYKQQQVKEIFEHMGGLKGFEMLPTIPSEKIFYYRNKMEFSFADKRWLDENDIGREDIPDKYFALGLHIPRIFDKVLDIDECFLQSELSNKILNFTRKFFKEKNTSIYSTKTHTGYLRNLVIRQSAHTKDLMVNLVTSEENDELMNEYSSLLIKEIPQVTTFINNINLKKAAIAVGDYEKVYHGDGYIFDKIGDYSFRISANSFFQTNTFQSENLYGTALEFADLKGNEFVYDLFSGAGTITIYLSSHVKKIFGFESVPSALEDAKENCELNNVRNVKFIKADLYKSILPIVEKRNVPNPDVVIADPPRSGLHKNTVADIVELNPKKIVYVSCNPSTQVRDIKMLAEAGYRLVKMKPVDMFPHTFHIENVALLIK